MSIIVEKPGLLTTVQDGGRVGFQQYGMPVAGAMDLRSYRLANALLGNPADCAALEITLVGPVLRFEQQTVIAITGANIEPQLNGEAIAMWQTVDIQAGDRLSFGCLQSGARSYLAVAGGFDVPRVMGSRSTYLKAHIGGCAGRALRAGDQLTTGLALPANRKRRHIAMSDWPAYASHHQIRVVLGPQDDHFTQQGMATFVNARYTISQQSDRMGYQLTGSAIELAHGSDIISDGIAFGAIQVPNNGQPVIMMADHQTTGGYAKIATVITVDLAELAQAKPGDTVCFAVVSVVEAQQLLRQAALQEQSIIKMSNHFRHFRVWVNHQCFDVDVMEN